MTLVLISNVRNLCFVSFIVPNNYFTDNPINHFPVYEPTAERVAAIQEAASEAANPLKAHYDASRENRAKGAAFYTFSADEEQRAREMEALRKAREETEKARKETGAADVKPGESEGLAGPGLEGVDESASGKRVKEGSRAMEKRKRELEERRKLVEAKRRKVKGLPEVEKPEPSKLAPGMANAAAVTADPFSALEAAARKGAPSSDSLATSGTKKSRWDEKANVTRNQPSRSQNAADDFLAKLELDLTFKKGGS